MPQDFHLALHGIFHPLFEVYLVKLSTLLVPHFLLNVLASYQVERLHYRLLHVVLSAGTIVVVYLLVKEAFGKSAALFASAFVASCQFHIHFSRTVIQTAPLLFFVAFSFFLFWRAVKGRDDRYILFTGACLGIAYLCEETAVFLLLIFCIFLLLSGDLVPWLKKWQTYAALVIFLIIISPDLYWNLTAQSSDIGFHLARAARFKGVSLLPSSLFVGELLLMLPKDLEAFTGGLGRQAIWTLEYPTMHWVLGIICLLAMGFSVRRWKDPFTRLMIIAFAVVFLFFTFAASTGLGRNYNFWWASGAYIPAVVLSGDMFSRLFRRGNIGKVASLLILTYLFGHAIAFLEIRDPVYVRRPSFLARYYLDNGRKWLLQGRTAWALDNFQKSLQFEKSSIPALVNIAECYKREGNGNRALETMEEAKKNGLAAGDVGRFLMDTGYIKAWSISPFYRMADYERVKMTNEVLESARKASESSLSYSGSRQVESSSAFVDLKGILKNPPYGYAIAQTRINSPLRRKLRFLVGVTDGMTMWLNGRQIYEDHQKHLWFPDEDQIGAELIRGWNELVLCVIYESGTQYGFSIRILDEAGQVVDDLKYEAALMSKTAQGRPGER